MKKFEYKFKYSQEELYKIIDGFVFNSQNMEKDIFELLVKGYNCKQIAKSTGYSQSTIKRRRASLFKRIDVFLNNDNIKIDFKNAKEDVRNDEIRYCVYVLIFPNHKMYIGQTQDTRQRWRGGKGYRENKKMYIDIVKYGWDNILKCVIYDDLSYIQSLKKEQELIIKYKTRNSKYGYNKKLG